MTDRSLYSDATSPPLTGADFLAQYQARVKALLDASCFPLTSLGGTADAVTATLDPTLDGDGLVDGMQFSIKWAAANTGAVTLAINGGSAVPVLDSEGAALVAGALADGLVSLLVVDGADLRVVTPLASAGGTAAPGYYLAITSSATWTKPDGFSADRMVTVEAWGGGGGGGRNSSNRSSGGGGGGGYAMRRFRFGDLPSSVAFTIGAGGAGRTGSSGNGTAGGNTTFGTLLTAYGGAGGGFVATIEAFGGGGGGEIAAASGRIAGAIGGGNGGNGASVATPGSHASTIFGGGGGGGGGSSEAAGGSAAYGGAGGGSPANSTATVGAGGVSAFGGGGGASARGSGTTASAGTAPAGGGGGGGGDANGGAGARGEIRIWI